MYEKRHSKLNLKTRESDSGEKILECYFAKFNTETELWAGAYEEISPEAFTDTIKTDDIRALINHDTTLVLGRTKAGTLNLEVDEVGLKGTIVINPNDTDALNLYERVKRGDVSGNSFGFEIIKEETQYKEDGSIKWILKEVKLYEVSVTTFPAYEDTTVEARKKDLAEINKSNLERKKESIRRKLNNAKTTNVK